MAMNAMQVMLKSMGMGDAIEGVQKLIASGAIDKIINFADAIGEMNGRLTAIECELAKLCAAIAPKQSETDIRSGNVGHASGDANGRYRPAISDGRQLNGGNTQ